jgi:hypothetical protein
MAGSSRRYAPKARFVQRNPILFSGWSPGIRRELVALALGVHKRTLHIV